jgi:adenylyltransferase/sulfurtransferase
VVDKEALRASIESGSLDYVQFCGGVAAVDELSEAERVDARAYGAVVKGGTPHLLVDVRERVQFELCALAGSVNVPFSEISGRLEGEEGERLRRRLEALTEGTELDAPVYVVCRLGNDSQVAVKRFKELGLGGERWIGDIKGGLRKWRQEVDSGFPEY